LNKTTKKAVLGAVVIFCAAIFIFTLMFYNPLNFLQNNLVSLSQISVDSQGASIGSTGKLTGTFWILQGYVDAKDIVQGFLLPSGTEKPLTVAGIQELVKNTASVQINIEPLQPYLIRDLQIQQVTVAPSAVSPDGKSSVSSLPLQYYQWNEPSFRIYTPYQITVLRNWQQIGSMTINTQGNSNTQTVSTSAGPITIQNLGGLQGTYLTPDTPSQIAILTASSYVYDWAQISTMVNGMPMHFYRKPKRFGGLQ
jgi:hypothetical protein